MDLMHDGFVGVEQAVTWFIVVAGGPAPRFTVTRRGRRGPRWRADGVSRPVVRGPSPRRNHPPRRAATRCPPAKHVGQGMLPRQGQHLITWIRTCREVGMLRIEHVDPTTGPRRRRCRRDSSHARCRAARRSARMRGLTWPVDLMRPIPRRSPLGGGARRRASASPQRRDLARGAFGVSSRPRSRLAACPGPALRNSATALSREALIVPREATVDRKRVMRQGVLRLPRGR
jgi:hypothetical protein